MCYADKTIFSVLNYFYRDTYEVYFNPIKGYPLVQWFHEF